MINGFASKSDRFSNPGDAFELPRRRMVEQLRTQYGIRDERVLSAMMTVPRHLFVPEALSSQAYKDNALPLAAGQTVSQPFIVARMTELLCLKGNERVLEIGFGSGYQTAILSLLARKIYAIERIKEIADVSKARLMSLGFRNVSYRVGDGTLGWPIYAPFDAILVAAGGPKVPETLIGQLATGGRLVMPVGAEENSQKLVRVTLTDTGLKTEEFGRCSFVPLIGQFGWEA
ncbi:MAG: protein-L-isoaspartate(D-aspartate) O-methyltransferase [Pyrinomonadaceae bacterium]|jgi:protein-L-isoaspartate(D-aspartate) O-methyltransferase